ncbi:D-serine ammonia-lyase [Cohaesibacter sp. ES.047]|uniref:D-serine ammonia-lyase n=1 Tax=Cohaesibacter sp. ES.047 TaxID=1798205 RepID=UPI000BB9A020|nr:D-serine ammonia-lyase [Cohaesibacter sp. ES.047]
MSSPLEAPLLDRIKSARPTLWCNPAYVPAVDPEAAEGLSKALDDWALIAPLLEALFPQLKQSGGEIASDLIDVPDLQTALGYGAPHFGRLFVKGDHDLPVAGSVKARGGLFEVLMHAVNEARAFGFLAADESLTKLASTEAHSFFGRRTIAVGSTGNLGLSVGLAARTLGYNVVVHMSADAKEWKIERLRRFGVKVMQYEGDYNLAVAAARDAASRDPLAYFVDDEDSELLFRGYSAAAAELKTQLEDAGIVIGPDRPLFLYLPCGIGGAPGGIAYGARAVFGPDVHCFFAEPVQSPSALVQMMHGSDQPLPVYEFGLSNKTEADGMAVATMSQLVARRMRERLAGVYTAGDDDLFRWVSLAYSHAGLQIEPSAAIGFAGPHFLLSTEAGRHFCATHLAPDALNRAVHVAWATGGSLVPEVQFQTFVDRGSSLGSQFDLMREDL